MLRPDNPRACISIYLELSHAMDLPLSMMSLAVARCPYLPSHFPRESAPSVRWADDMFAEQVCQFVPQHNRQLDRAWFPSDFKEVSFWGSLKTSACQPSCWPYYVRTDSKRSVPMFQGRLLYSDMKARVHMPPWGQRLLVFITVGYRCLFVI